MSKQSRAQASVSTGETAERLLHAAASEFARAGFAGTDSNKIARAAGFAPQTFYRWYDDKIAIFVAVYRAWQEQEHELVAGLLRARASTRRIADALVAHHRDHLIFRRSLRHLAVQNDAVRKARAESRLRQIARVREWGGTDVPKPSELAVLILQIERLADALAERELADLGMDERSAYRALSQLLAQLLGRTREG